ncbi:MAG TPA: FecR family protein [Planctomycetota bacterium]|nr:FecR family protein [Planctomycetota bacterium]
MSRQRFEELLNRYEDSLASAAELEELAALLEENADFRRELVERNRLETGLHELGATLTVANRPSVRKAAARVSIRRHAKKSHAWNAVGIAAALVLAIGAALWLGSKSTQPAHVLAQVEDAADATTTRTGKVEPLKNGAALHPGDTITSGPAGRMTLAYADGTRVFVAHDTQMIVALESGAKHVRILRGEVSATVAKQRAGQPMIFKTSNAQATVIGTQLKIAAAGESTRLEVISGVVQLRRSNDGQSVEVTAGKFVVAENGKPLVVNTVSAITEIIKPAQPILKELGTPVLSENFENGKLEGWDGGRLAEGGNAGSRYAIEAVSQAEREYGVGLAFTAVKLPTSRLPNNKRDVQSIFTYQPGLIVSFAYFLEGDVSHLRVQGVNNEQDDNFGVTIENPVQGQWTILQLKLDDFLHNEPSRRAEKLRSGETFKNLTFYAGARGQRVKRFLIDDVVVAPLSNGAK